MFFVMFCYIGTFVVAGLAVVAYFTLGLVAMLVKAVVEGVASLFEKPEPDPYAPDDSGLFVEPRPVPAPDPEALP